MSSPARAQWWFTSTAGRPPGATTMRLSLNSTSALPPGPFIAIPFRTNEQFVHSGADAAPRRYVLK